MLNLFKVTVAQYELRDRGTSFYVNGRPERTFTPRTRRERGAAGYVLACHRCTQRPGTALRLKVPPDSTP